MRTYQQKPTGGFARRNPVSNFEFVFRAIADRLGLSYEELAAANGYKQLTSILGIFRPFGYTTTYACLSFIETLRDLGATRDEVRMLLETHLAEIVNVTLIKRLKPEARDRIAQIIVEELDKEDDPLFTPQRKSARICRDRLERYRAKKAAHLERVREQRRSNLRAHAEKLKAEAAARRAAKAAAKAVKEKEQK